MLVCLNVESFFFWVYEFIESQDEYEIKYLSESYSSSARKEEYNL